MRRDRTRLGERGGVGARESITAADDHVCRPGTVVRLLTPAELAQPLNANRPPDVPVRRQLPLSAGAVWTCDCGRQWHLVRDHKAMTTEWRRLSER